MITHQRIIANAGSGKTFTLTSRFIDLLDHNVPPERIVALTFTRKAAGEFLTKIFARVLEDSSPAGLVRLRLLIDALPRLALGTLDGFFGRMVRAFPFECGLAGDLSLLDANALAQARRQVMDAVFRGHSETQEIFDEFLDLIRQQNRNSEGRDVTDTLTDEIESLHERYLLTPPGTVWGDAAAIWPDGEPFAGSPPPGALAAQFARELDGIEEMRDRWDTLIETLTSLRTGSPAGEAAIKFALQAIDPPMTKEGGFTLKIFGNKKFPFDPAVRPLVVQLGQSILHLELQTHLTRTRALHTLVGRFEGPYQKLIRDTGRLTFTDITGLLASAGGAVWAGRTMDPFDRQEIDFRLDATYDHWLLDEFQDTSRLQWMAARNLVDEVVQDDSGRRTFFYVGDTKQAIYTWRGGDPRLFDEISDHYNQSGTERIDTSGALEKSYRSVPEILDLVNTLFAPAHLDAQAEALTLPADSLHRWQLAWRNHIPDRPARDCGCVHWQRFEGAKKEDLDQETANLIHQLEPLRHGRTCAVLVRSNKRVLSVIDALRHAGIDARSEGKFHPCTDNDLGTALLALLRTLAHPADTFSLEHVRMTPLRRHIEAPEFREDGIRLLRQHGFAHALDHWIGDLPRHDFARSRAREILQAATAFDSSRGASGTIDEFLPFAESYQSSDEAASGAVRVLTVHASKGLDFDMVVLPDIEGSVIASRRRDAPLHLQCDHNGNVLWGMELPPQAICETDATLADAAADVLAADTYESLCLYYVALTRARYGLYLLTSRQKSSSKSRDFNRLLHETFPGADDIYLTGNPDWIPTDAVPNTKSPAPEFNPLPDRRHKERQPEFPSRQFHGPAPFSADSSARSLGTEIHTLLARMTWLDDPLPDLTKASPAASTVMENFLRSPAGLALFTRPKGKFTLWREQPYDVLLDGRWISGVFDRVVLTPDGAELIDFKTGGNDLVATYEEQMNLYTRSLALLTGLPPNRITPVLINLQTAQRFEIAKK